MSGPQTIVIRLVGGQANGFVFAVPEITIPKFVGAGYPVAHYKLEPGTGEVRIFRYVPVH